MINAIETHYAGCHFRSRLEARWAVFFDALDIEWLYEPEGITYYEYNYLPDFYLPRSHTWVEVKGSLDDVDWRKLSLAVDFGHLPNTCNGWDSKAPSAPGLLLLGNPPRPTRGHVPTFPLLQHYKGVRLEPAIFSPAGFLTQRQALNHDVAVLRYSSEERWQREAADFVERGLLYEEIFDGWLTSGTPTESWVKCIKAAWPEQRAWYRRPSWVATDRAFELARSARFGT
jgi:hypothetical protein